MEILRLFPLFLLISFLTCGRGENLLPCLSSGGIYNVTTYNNPTYFQLLDSSLMSLRYAGPNVPKPFALIFPMSVHQLSTSIRCARKSSLLIRVRSGGHSFEGFSSFAEGPFVIIDMANLDKVIVDLNTTTAWVESGATLGQLYYAIGTSTNKYAFTGGVCPTVGVGGHFSGGGVGMLSRKYGLSVDNIVDAILIDAQGRTLDRKAMGEEIFWAIRGGGGGSWGVVAAWKVQLVPIPEKVTTFILLKVGTTSQAAKLWYKWQMVAPKLEDEFFIDFSVNPRNDTAGISTRFVGMYLGPKASALSIISKAFPELNVTSEDCKEVRWVEAIVYLWGSSAIQTVEDLKNRTTYPKLFFKLKFDYMKEPIPEAALKGALDMIANQPKSSMQVDPYGGYINRIRSDAVPFPHRSNLFSIQYSITWEEVDDRKSDEYINWIRSLYNYMGKYVSKNPRVVYVNMIDLDLGSIDWKKPGLTRPVAVKLATAWGKAYFLNNYHRLVRAKTLIDPLNVFQNPQSIPPLTLPST